jgi:diguanylate cyclase (GGDEF)-like protein/PAS domain S-box-containing protein
MLDAQGIWPATIQVADRGYFSTAMREQRSTISEPVVSRVTQEVVVILTHPLPAQGGLVLGSVRLRSRDLLSGIADMADTPGIDNAALGTPVEAPALVVTDSQARILAHPDKSLISAPLSAEPLFVGALNRWRQAGSPAESSGLEFSDGQRLVAVAGVAGPDWLVWQSTPRAAVLAPLMKARGEAMRWAASLTLGLALALLLLMWRLLHPLSRLEARAERLFDASLDPQAGWPQASGEIGRLERVMRHVSAERAQLEAFNHRVIQRLESVMTAAPVGIAFMRDRRFELVSGEFCQLLGRCEKELLNQPAQLIFGANSDYQRLGAEVHPVFAAGQIYSGEWELLRGDGSRVWARLRAQPVDAREPLAGTIWTAHDITTEISNRQALEWAATHDPLTGLANRAALDRRLAGIFSALPQRLPSALVLVDLDRFKPINDQHGHAAGDAMLRAVSAAAARRVRPGDLLVRLGGDEFVVVLEHCPADVALRVAEDVRHAISSLRLAWEGCQLDVGASAGVAQLTDLMPDAAAWLAAADLACYEAKSAGRGRVCQTPQGPGQANLRLVFNQGSESGPSAASA